MSLLKGPYDEFTLCRVRLNQLGLLSTTLGCSDFWQNWQHKQAISSSLSLTFVRLIKPDKPCETPFKQPDLLAFSGFYFPLVITIFVGAKFMLIKPENFLKLFSQTY